MAFVHYDRERWCSKCGEKKKTTTVIFCGDCGNRLRYKVRMKRNAARAARLERNKEA